MWSSKPHCCVFLHFSFIIPAASSVLPQLAAMDGNSSHSTDPTLKSTNKEAHVPTLLQQSLAIWAFTVQCQYTGA
jgi:hypothetical protein